MPDSLHLSFRVATSTLAAAAGAVLFATQCLAQGIPPPQGGPPAANPICQRLEAQLAAVDRGGGADPARAEQIRRYEDAAARQSAELDRVTNQAKRMGCDSSGFFSLFSNQSAQCGPVNNQIQQMRGNLDQITTSLERLRGSGGSGSFERDQQKRSVIAALAQNNCGPQYANRANQGGGFFDTLFGGGGNNNNNPGTSNPDFGAPSSTYKTVCVRTCDGFYFPVSYATSPARFGDDEQTCKSLCPAAEATLFTYRNNEDMTRAVSINGQPYSALPNAFKYRQAFNPSCACKAQGQTWADALKSVDDKGSVEQGDIVVTDERAKQMSQPRDAQGRPARPPQAQPTKGGTAATETPPAAAAAPATPPAGDRPIRTVGPTFIPSK
jgi:hypothetical protein